MCQGHPDTLGAGLYLSEFKYTSNSHSIILFHQNMQIQLSEAQNNVQAKLSSSTSPKEADALPLIYY